MNLPMPVRRVLRAVQNFFIDLWQSIKGLWRSVIYFLRMRRFGLSERYVREAFSYLVDLDIGELAVVEGYAGIGRLKLKAWGNEVHILHENEDADEPGKWNRVYEVIIGEYDGRLYASEWRAVNRIVTMEYGSKIETHWWVFFRTGRVVDPQSTSRLCYYLRMIYGEKPEVETK